MKKLTILAIGALLALGGANTLACEYPSRVDIPDGDTASKDEMIEGQRNVKSYVATMEAYLKCLVDEEKAARAQLEEMSAEDEQLREDMLNKKYNAAVDEMENVAARFNAEVQAYKAREE